MSKPKEELHFETFGDEDKGDGCDSSTYDAPSIESNYSPENYYYLLWRNINKFVEPSNKFLERLKTTSLS